MSCVLSGGNPSVDAVREFQVTTSNYSAAFGSEAFAHVNLVTKSDTKSLHGAKALWAAINAVFGADLRSSLGLKYYSSGVG